MEETRPSKKHKEFKNNLKMTRETNREKLAEFNPFDETKDTTGCPIKTLFIGNLNFKTTEDTLQKEFGFFGPIKKIRLVKD